MERDESQMDVEGIISIKLSVTKELETKLAETNVVVLFWIKRLLFRRSFLALFLL